MLLSNGLMNTKNAKTLSNYCHKSKNEINEDC